MTHEVLEEGAACLLILNGYLLVLLIGGLMADYLFPHIPFIERFTDSLPEFEDDVELDRLERERIRHRWEVRRKARTARRRRA